MLLLREKISFCPSIYYKISWKTKWRIFEKNSKKSKKWSHRNEKTSFLVDLSKNVKKKITFLGPITSILTFFADFSKMRQSILTLQDILSIMKFFVKFFIVNLPMLNIYKFHKKRNFDPTTWRTSRTTSRWRSTQKVRATQNFIKY